MHQAPQPAHQSATGELAPAHTVKQDLCDDICRSVEPFAVSNNRLGHITDEEREQAIARAAKAIEQHMADVAEINNRVPHVFSDFADAAASRWMADRARQLMQRLIAQRSPEQVAKNNAPKA